MKKQIASTLVNLLAVVLTLNLAACAAPLTPSATPSQPALTLTNTSVPTNTATPHPPTATREPTTTPQPTKPPAAEPDSADWRKLKEDNYTVVVTASIVGPDGYTYVVYELDNPATPDRIGTCEIQFYYWDGAEYKLLDEIQEAAECDLFNWDDADGPAAYVSDNQRRAFKLNGYWSDINQNGLPELAVDYDYCLMGNDCYDDSFPIKFYEIHNQSVLVEITASIVGTLVPYHMLHSENPLTIYALNFEQYGAPRYLRIYWWRVYQWEYDQFIDVTTQYPDEYQSRLDEAIAKLKEGYGSSLVNGPFDKIELILTIPVLYNGASLPREDGLQTFLDVTDPNNWPGTEKVMVCWLQLARAYAQIDYEKGVPFQIHSPYNYYGADFEGDLAREAKELDATRFDVSACQ